MSDAVEESIRNREQIESAETVGCFFCLETFKGSEVTEFCDNGKTGICPKCGVDSLLPNEDSIDKLSALCEKWFTAPSSLSGSENL